MHELTSLRNVWVYPEHHCNRRIIPFIFQKTRLSFETFWKKWTFYCIKPAFLSITTVTLQNRNFTIDTSGLCSVHLSVGNHQATGVSLLYTTGFAYCFYLLYLRLLLSRSVHRLDFGFLRSSVAGNFWRAKFLTSNHERMQRVILYTPNTLIKLIIRGQRWADCEISQSESSPDPIKFNPIQSWSAHVKSCIIFCQKHYWSYFAFSQIQLV